ncbi:hypothetical protein PTTG_00381 [Puccinia triticina 1-1 BBBD Race 1]|uniref:Uncharacterized protein n=1 Tax=Puccinia triticina (isolate 1-1 / race 1 (BBBD)) TaxID=630390 RepID=A0A180GZT7_PUCT1|nr:hypothetical protein PTTG_00381 [Puccinia triticina 1-1 BBBD Race 1]
MFASGAPGKPETNHFVSEGGVPLAWDHQICPMYTQTIATQSSLSDFAIIPMPNHCENISSGKRRSAHKMRERPGATTAAESGPTPASRKIKLAENPKSKSLAERISEASAKDTVAQEKTEKADSAQRAGEQIEMGLAVPVVPTTGTAGTRQAVPGAVLGTNFG